MKRLVAAVLIAGAICVVPQSSRASSCIIPDVTKAYQQARAVFLGEVVGVVEPLPSEASAPVSSRLFKIRFKVERAWKGVFSSTFEVLSSQSGGSFGLYLGRNPKKYIVYADPLFENGVYHPHKTVISHCGRTASVSESEKRSSIRLGDTFDRTNGIADVNILDWRYPPLTFSAYGPSPLGARLRLALSRQVERDGFTDEILQGRLVNLVAFVDVDGASHVPFETGIE